MFAPGSYCVLLQIAAISGECGSTDILSQFIPGQLKSPATAMWSSPHRNMSDIDLDKAFTGASPGFGG